MTRPAFDPRNESSVKPPGLIAKRCFHEGQTCKRGFVALFCATLLALGLITRLPFRARYLYSSDEVQFALGAHDFNIAQFRPHPPGYTLFVGMLRVSIPVIRDDNLRLVAWGTAASGLSAALLFLLSLRLFQDRRIAVLSSILWLTNPILWFSSEVGSIYSMGALASITTAYFALRFWQKPTERAAILAGGSFAAAVGLRQDQILLLLPVWLLPAVRYSKCRRFFPLSIIVFALGYVTWYLPTVVHAGGYRAYSSLVRQQFWGAAKGTSVFWGGPPVSHAWMLVRLGSSLAVGLLPVLLVASIFIWKKDTSAAWRALMSDERLHFLLIWALPSIIFFGLVHFAKTGYILTCLAPMAVLVSSVVLGRAPFHRAASARFTALVLSVGVANTLFFLLCPRLQQPSVRAPVRWTSGVRPLLPRILNQTVFDSGYGMIRASDQINAAYIGEISQALKHGNGAIILISTNSPGLCSLSWRSLMYSFPQTPVLSIAGLGGPSSGNPTDILFQLGFEKKENWQSLRYSRTPQGEVRAFSLAGRKSGVLIFPHTLSNGITISIEGSATSEVAPTGSAPQACQALSFDGLKWMNIRENATGRLLLLSP